MEHFGKCKRQEGQMWSRQFLGAAPEASIAVVKLKEAKQYLKEFYAIQEEAVCYQENDIMLDFAI